MLNAIEIVRYIDCGHITADTITSDQLSDLCQYVADIQTDAKVLVEFLSALESPLDEFEEFEETFERWQESDEPQNIPLDAEFKILREAFNKLSDKYQDISWDLENLSDL